jgi:transcriptional regulator with XRE-family HTH domain
MRRNRERQRELYGEPLGCYARRVMTALDINQARLAGALGLSQSMLSQLISGRRMKIANPIVLARLMLLDQRSAALPVPIGPERASELLSEVRRSRPVLADRSIQALRAAAPPTQLNAAASTLAADYPALAAVLRRAAAG